MNYLYAALDESSDGYYALIVGDKAAIDRLVSRIPPTFVHMASWHGDDDEKREIIRNLDFEGNVLAHCAKFGLKELDSKIGDALLSGKCRMPTTKINSKIGYEMARAIDSFLASLPYNVAFP